MDAGPARTNASAAAIRREADRSTAKAGWAATGGILGALAASSCCILPFLLFLLGVSGAWIGNLTALEPYQPIFAAAALGCVGLGAWRLRRKSKLACADGYCATPRSDRIAKMGLWAAGVLVVVAVGFPYVIRFFFAA
jgi:mercuric ion transport protein